MVVNKCQLSLSVLINATRFSTITLIRLFCPLNICVSLEIVNSIRKNISSILFTIWLLDLRQCRVHRRNSINISENHVIFLKEHSEYIQHFSYPKHNLYNHSDLNPCLSTTTQLMAFDV